MSPIPIIILHTLIYSAFSQNCLTNHEYYDYLSNSCLPCSYNCLTCFDSSICVACTSSYYLDQTTNACESCLFGCSVCTDSTSCTTCQDGLYINSNGQCLACQTGVRTCSIALVESCSDGYFLLGEICAGCLENCRTCSDFITCTLCSTGYYLNSQQTGCEICPSNCEVCTDSSTCTSCIQGFSLNSSSQCYQEDCSSISAFCKKCSGGVCLECEIGKYSEGGSCVQGASILCLQAYGPYFTDCETSNYECPTFANVQTDTITGTQIDVCLPKHSDQYSQYVYLSYSDSDCDSASCSNAFSKTIQFEAIKAYYEIQYEISIKLYSSSTHNLKIQATNNLTSVSLQNSHTLDITNEISEGLQESGCSGCPYGITQFSGTLAVSGSASNTNLQVSSQNGQFSILEIMLILPICQVDKCSECETANDCESCEDPYYLQLIECVMECDAGFYINGQTCVLQCPSDTYPIRSTYQCQSCQSPCLTCSSQTDCLSCVDEYYLEETSCVKNCSSNSLYPDSTTGNCEECPNPCSTCQIIDNNSTVQCLSCDVGYLYEGNGSCTYICPEGTFANFIDNITQCSMCNNSCTHCYISESECTGCQSGYLLDEGTCHYNYTCPDGFYEDGSLNSCEKCHYPCQSCTQTINDCLSCLKGALYNDSCPLSCPDGMHIDYSNGSQICVSCPSECILCTASDYCLSCTNGTYFFQGKCYSECPTDEYYEDPQNSVCLLCVPPCSQCISQTQCLQCSTGYLDTISLSCTLQCNSSAYVQSNFTCVLCTPPCISCYSNTSCTQCDLPYALYQQSCITISECGNLDRYVQYTYNYSTDPQTQLYATCRSCTYPCAGCSQSSIQCSSCQSGYIMVEQLQTCVQSCPISYYQFTNSQNTTCEKCQGTCLTCEVTSDNCTSCGTGMYLYEYECLLQCPSLYYQNNDDALCYACEAPCGQCYSQYLCETCSTGILYNKVCVDDCPEGSIMNDTANTCDLCTDNCLTCSVQTSNCTDCPNGFYYYDYQCLTVCPSGYYDDYYSKNCEVCSEPCDQCSSSSSCITCVSNYYLSGDDCLTDCPTGYYADNVTYLCEQCNTTICRQCSSDPNTCTQCAAGYYYDSLQQNSCVTSCPQSTYADPYTLTCKTCVYPCTVCSSLNVCSACESSYKIYDNYCYSSCPIGYYEGSNSTCEVCNATCEICSDYYTCVSCIQNYFVDANNNCVQECGSGYYEGYQQLTNYGTCIECEIGCLECISTYECTLCDNTGNTSLYLFNGLCLDQCPILYFGTSSNECSACSDYCNSCVNASYCTQCLNSYIYNNLCYLQCPAYTYPFNEQSCLDCQSPCQQCTSQFSCESCLDGFMYYQSYCVVSCPEDIWFYPQNNSCSTTCPYNKFINTQANTLQCYVDGCGGMMVQLNGYCFQKCPNDYYVDRAQNCELCSGNQICDNLFTAELTALRTYNLKLGIYFSQQSQLIDEEKIQITFLDINGDQVEYEYKSISIEEYRIIIEYGHTPLTLYTVNVLIPYAQSLTTQQSIIDNSLSTNVYIYNNYSSYLDSVAVKQIALLFVILLFVLVLVNIVVKSSHFLQIMDFMQFISATIYLQIQYPNILEEYLSSLTNILWTFNPSLSDYLPYNQSPSKFYEYHSDCSILRTQGLTVIVFFLIILTFAILLLVHYCNEKCQQGLMQKLIKRIKYRHLNDTFNIFMLPILIFSFHFSRSSVADIVMSIIVIVVCIGFLVLISYKILTAKSPKQLPGLLSQLEENESSLAQMYTPFSYIRKIIFALVLGLQPDKPMSTLTILLIFTVLILVCLYFYKPFKNIVTDYICIFFEIVLVVYVLFIILFGLNVFEGNQMAAHILGIVCVSIICITLAIGIGWLIYLTIMTIKEAWNKKEQESTNKQKENENENEENVVKNAKHYDSQKISIKEKKSEDEQGNSANQLVNRGHRGSIDPFSEASGNDEFRHWGGDSEEESNDNNHKNPPNFLVKMDKSPVVMEDI